MAKYDVTFSCGHTQRIELYGKEVDRRKKIEYFEREGLCSDCYKKTLRSPEEPVIENGCLVLDYAEHDANGTRRVKTGYKEGQMTYREVPPEKDFTVRIPLAEMAGSEKQVKWATDIKIKFIKEKLQKAMENIDLMLLAAEEMDPEADSLQDAVDLILKAQTKWTDFLREPSAKTVIDMDQNGKLFLL